jgi:hypothetical protein
MSNGLQNGLDRGLAAGTFEGTRRGELSGVVGNDKIIMDKDALAFVLAAKLSNSLDIQAINYLVSRLKIALLWNKIRVLYPMVGGSSETCKFNLKDPRDLDVAFRLVFSGGWTFSRDGIIPNGNNTTAETFFVIPISMQNSLTFSYYSLTNVIANQVEMGVYSNSNDFAYLLYNFSGAAYKGFNSTEAIRGSVYNPTTSLLLASRNSSSNVKYYHQGRLIDDLSFTSRTPSTSSVILGRYANYGLFHTSKVCAMAHIGESFTDQDASNFYNIVQRFQTILGRQV